MSKTARDKLEEPKVVCPHCWHNYYENQALFISRHPALVGDSVVSPGDTIPRRYAASEAQKTREGFICDERGWKMTDRACPRCHLQVPVDLLKGRPFFISIAGAPKAGKTYFLTSMLHGVREELPKHFGLSFRESDSEDAVTFLDEYENKLFSARDADAPVALRKTEEVGLWYNTVKLDGAPVQLPKPFIFSVLTTDIHPRAKKLKQNIVLYDNAGEHFNLMAERTNKMASHVTLHLAECDAVLFVFDPLQDRNTRDKLLHPSIETLGREPDPQLTTAVQSARQDTILTEVVNRIRRHRDVPPGKRLDVPFAFCVQKWDVWKSLVPFGETIDNSSIHFSQSFAVGGLDVEELNAISLLVRRLIHDLDPGLATLAESEFEVVRYFPISALGTSPFFATNPQSNVLELSIRPRDIVPFRVSDPLLWLLYKQNYIYRKKVHAESANKYPHARVETGRASGRVIVTSPSSKDRFDLDIGYCNGSIVDPKTGVRMWIPSPVAAPSDSQPTDSASGPSQAKPAPPTLKLNESPKQKRGWFHKGN